MNRQPLALALVHYPVLDRRGDLVTTAVTNLDLHDIARTARTYGIIRYYVVTPVEEQQLLVARILGHWQEGFGAAYNPDRREALSLLATVATLEEALADWRTLAGAAALPVLTGASRSDGISFADCRSLAQEHPLLLVFGTGWGLAPGLFEAGWLVLAPVRGTGDYNHLPVRAAAAIILDRLFGDQVQPIASR
jgi:hypothetical protein